MCCAGAAALNRKQGWRQTQCAYVQNSKIAEQPPSNHTHPRLCGNQRYPPQPDQQDLETYTWPAIPPWDNSVAQQKCSLRGSNTLTTYPPTHPATPLIECKQPADTPNPPSTFRPPLAHMTNTCKGTVTAVKCAVIVVESHCPAPPAAEKHGAGNKGDRYKHSAQTDWVQAYQTNKHEACCVSQAGQYVDKSPTMPSMQ